MTIYYGDIAKWSNGRCARIIKSFVKFLCLTENYNGTKLPETTAKDRRSPISSIGYCSNTAVIGLHECFTPFYVPL